MSSSFSIRSVATSKLCSNELMLRGLKFSEIKISFSSFIAPIFKELSAAQNLLAPFFRSEHRSVAILHSQVDVFRKLLALHIKKMSSKFDERIGFWRKYQSPILETFANDEIYSQLVIQQLDVEKSVLTGIIRTISYIRATLDFLHHATAPLKNKYTKEVEVYRRDLPAQVHKIALSIFQGNRWQPGPLVGNGAYGKVYLIIGPDRQPYALKFFGERADLLALRRGIKTYAVDACEEETCFLQQLGSHPHIPQYICQFENSIISEFVDASSFGKSFPAFLDAQYYENVRAYIKQLVAIVGYVHSRGILHGDLKPDNILIDQQGMLKLIDFGCARVIGTKNYDGPQIFGAPELFVRDFPQKEASDVWSIGMNLYYLLTKKYLGEGFENSWKLAELLMKNGKEGLLVKELLPQEMPRREEAVDFLEKALKFDPQKRPQSTQELLAHSYLKERLSSTSSRQPLHLPEEGREPATKRSRH